MSKLPQGGRLCPQRQDDTNQEPSGEKRLTETITEGFFFFSFFCLKVEQLSGLQTITRLRWERLRPSCPEGVLR